jgi:tetratricopeptide (TPR) repeat protein
MSGVTWLHLSDWHQKGTEFDRKVVCDALMQDISERSKRIGPELERIDFIVFSGDITFSGKAQEYEAAVEYFFNPLLKATGLGWDRLFIVPGNHDLDRDKLDDVPSDIIKSLDSREGVNSALETQFKRFALWHPFEDYSKFALKYMHGNKEEVKKPTEPAFYYVNPLTVDGKSIAVICLNSAWLSGRNKDSKGKVYDYGNLVLGEPQCLTALKQHENVDVCIAVLHHPFSWLVEFDRNLMEEHTGPACHFILHGHEHRPRINVVSSTMGDVITIPAGASYDRRIATDPRYINAYNFVHLYPDTDLGTVYLRRWVDPLKWDADLQLWKDGRFSFKLPKKTETGLTESPIPEYLQREIEAGEKLIEEKEYPRAIKHFEGILKIIPYSFQANRYMGHLLSKVQPKEHEKVKEHLDRAIKMKPDYSQPYDIMGWMYHDNNEIDKAIESMEKACQLARLREDHLRECWHINNLIWFYTMRNNVEHGDLKKATELTTRIEELLRKEIFQDVEAAYLDTKGTLLWREYQHTGEIAKFLEAERFFKVVYEKGYDIPEVHEHLAQVGREREKLEVERKIPSMRKQKTGYY